MVQELSKPDSELIRQDVALIHELVAGSSGKLVLATFGEDPESGRKLKPMIEGFNMGEPTRMANLALQLAREPHRNVYVTLSLMRPDLPWGKKGTEADVIGVLGIVADFDAKDDPEADRWHERLPIAPTMVLETSSDPAPSFQCRFLFKEPLPFGRAKAIALAIQRVSGCDTCSVDMSHVWRLAGGLNWPNKLKVEKFSRPAAPQLVSIVESFDGDRLIDPDEIEALLEVERTSSAEGKPSQEGDKTLKPDRRISLEEFDRLTLPRSLNVIVREGRDPNKPKKQDDSRSAWLFHAVCGLLREGVDEETVRAIITDGKFKISASVLDKGRRAVDYARRQVERATAELHDPRLQALNTEHAVIENYGSKTIVITFAPEGGFTHRSFEDFRKSYDNRKVEIGGDDGRPVMKGLGSWFLDHPQRRQYRSVEFLPGRETAEGILNLYRGPSIQPTKGECSKFVGLIRDIICAGNDEVADWVLRYLAHLFQKPWETPEVCLVLRGRQGVGKNFFAERVGEIIADYFLVVANSKHLVGSFNRHLMDKLLVFADEAFYGKERGHAGILKNLVTQSHMAVEPKGVDVFMAKKYFRLVMASNEDFVVPADIDDRRFLVIDVSPERAKDHDYFRAVDQEWRSGGREAFYDLLLNLDISEFNHRLRPETPALYEQKLHSLMGAERVVYEMLVSGHAPIAAVEKGHYFIPTDSLRYMLRRDGIVVSTKALADELRTISFHESSTRVQLDRGQARGFWVCELKKARELWAQSKRMRIDWPDDDGMWLTGLDISPI